MLRNSGHKITELAQVNSDVLIQNRVQSLRDNNSVRDAEMISYGQFNSPDGGLRLISYLQRPNSNKLKCSYCKFTVWKVSTLDWSETIIFSNESGIEQPNQSFTLDKDNAQIGFSLDGEYVLLISVEMKRNKIYRNKYYLSDVGIYDYADFIRRKVTFLQVTKKDGP